MNFDIGRILSALGPGLMAAGGQGWSAFGPGMMQGMQYYDQQKQNQLNNQQIQQLRELQQQQLQMSLEEQRDANKRRAKQEQDFYNLFGPGMMTPNQPPTGPSVGGMTQPGMLPGSGGATLQPGLMSSQFNPLQLQFIRAAGPEAMPIVAEQLFKQAEPQKGIEIGGVLVNPITGEKIADYSDVLRANAAAGRAQTTVNVGPTGIDYGDPETGLAWARNPDGSVRLDERGAPIAVHYQGSKAYLEITKPGEQKEATEAAQKKTADIVVQDIDRAVSLVDDAFLPTTGYVGEKLSKVGGTAANDVRALVDTVKANVGFDKLQAMRNASPTGGALGQVSDFENRNLQAVIGNLEQSQTAEQFKTNLARVKETYLDIIHGPGNRPQETQEKPKKKLKFNPNTGKLE